MEELDELFLMEKHWKNMMSYFVMDKDWKDILGKLSFWLLVNLQ